MYLLYGVCIAVSALDAGLLARSQYSEGPATVHLDTGFSQFPCVYKQMLRWFPRFKVATTCFSCSPPDLNLLVINFVFCIYLSVWFFNSCRHLLETKHHSSLFFHCSDPKFLVVMAAKRSVGEKLLVSHRAPPQVPDRRTLTRYGGYQGNKMPGVYQN